ncbi:hypothetical protein RYX36_015764 [Vicia faba]
MAKPFSNDSSAVTILSKCTVFPDKKSSLGDLKLSVSDLTMICSQYIQKGCLFTTPSIPSQTLITHLITSLSKTLSLFPPLAGRLVTDPDGYIYISCNDAGADFIHANATHLTTNDLLSPSDVHAAFKQFIPFHCKINYSAHFSPILAIQVTYLADGIFIGFAVSHAVSDGTTVWNFFNTFAEISRGVTQPSRIPNFRRDSILNSKAVLHLREDDINVTPKTDEPVRERIFSFTREAIQKLKARVNRNHTSPAEISSFQSLSALMWQCVTRARKLEGTKTTTVRIAVNIRNRLEPKLSEYYFGNAIQSIATYASACDVVGKDLTWCAEQLNKNIREYDSDKVRRVVEDFEREPKAVKMGNHDGGIVQIGSSPRFPMYDNDFGWGRPVAVRSGGGNKFDGKISAFPGKEAGNSVDMEVVLATETMRILENDPEFLLYAS